MATFLDLARAVTMRSGAGAKLTSTQGQVGRLALIVELTRGAWVMIQQSRPDWDFLYERIEASLAAGTRRATPAALGLSDHGRWIAGSFSCLDPREGEEWTLATMSYREWARCDPGGRGCGRPQAIAVGPSETLCFAPAPGRALTLRGGRYRAPQRLARDDDVPLCKPYRHDIIVHRALMSLASFDEAVSAYAAAKSDYQEMLSGLTGDHAPRIAMPGPLA